MTEFTTRSNAVDFYDERVVEDVIHSVEQYIKIHHAMPGYVGVNKYEHDNLKKARDAGVSITADFKGERTQISFHLSTANYTYPGFQKKRASEERRQ